MEGQASVSMKNILDVLFSPGPEVIKLFSCSNQLSTKFQQLIKTKMPTKEAVSCFKSLRCCIYHANKGWYSNIYEQDKFRAQLS